MADRDIKKAMSDSFKEGFLKIKRIDESGDELEEEEDEDFCENCEKKIDDALESFAYLIINDPNGTDVNELLFCCRKCWNEYLLRESERVKFESD